MSVDDSSRLASSPPSTDDHDKVQPTVRDARIGAAIGLLLIYAGTYISNWILRWLVIAVGLIFVGVMCAFMISVMWAKVSPRAHRIMSRARGQVQRDPQLSRLIRNVEAEAWEAEFKVRDRTVEILIDGKEEPNPALVARARELVADFDNFERRLVEGLSRADGREGVGLRDSGIGCRHQRAASLFDQAAIGATCPG
jgi:hypothetical protein